MLLISVLNSSITFLEIPGLGVALSGVGAITVGVVGFSTGVGVITGLIVSEGVGVMGFVVVSIDVFLTV
tara:strand:- start:2351 stop:2557 length:207 start_codon:yes stop_codon:yes gene_type:complete